MRGDWDFHVRCYRGDALVIHTTHKGTASMEIEVEAARAIMARGHYTRIIVSDMRLKWVRDCDIPRYQGDLSQVINAEHRPTPKTRRKAKP